MEKNSFKNQLGSMLLEKSAEEIEAFIERAKSEMSYYRCAIMEIETKFKVLNEQFSLLHERNPIESIKTRLKSFESIQEKLKRKKFPESLDSMRENLNDIAGVRVICSFIDDIYMLAECLIKQDDIRLIEMKDYIKNPKDNGYRSLHLIVEIPIFLCDEKKIVKAEVQLRTIAMESWAKLEHRMRYKKKLDAELLKNTERSLAECASMSNTLDEKMQEIRNVIEK